MKECPDVHRAADHCTVRMGHAAWRHIVGYFAPNVPVAVGHVAGQMNCIVELVGKLDQNPNVHMAIEYSVAQVDDTVACTFVSRSFAAHAGWS